MTVKLVTAVSKRGAGGIRNSFMLQAASKCKVHCCSSARATTPGLGLQLSTGSPFAHTQHTHAREQGRTEQNSHSQHTTPHDAHARSPRSSRVFYTWPTGPKGAAALTTEPSCQLPTTPHCGCPNRTAACSKPRHCFPSLGAPCTDQHPQRTDAAPANPPRTHHTPFHATAPRQGHTSPPGGGHARWMLHTQHSKEHAKFVRPCGPLMDPGCSQVPPRPQLQSGPSHATHQHAGQVSLCVLSRPMDQLLVTHSPSGSSSAVQPVAAWCIQHLTPTG